MCGEHEVNFRKIIIPEGSSPHVRGALTRFQRFKAASGIIPACAGSTKNVLLSPAAKWDHPRMCGEHFRSPVNCHVAHGIIPACAGSTLVVNGTKATDKGSSPHVRGAPNAWIEREDGVGIIPACAGSTACNRLWSDEARDHPRMCGEHTSLQFGTACFPGSSPHVRGARRVVRLARCRRGIIPACAGSTRPQTGWRARSRDHPRMCGEHSDASGIEVRHQGSSPHVRGAHCLNLVALLCHGIIPACAGSTRTETTGTCHTRDHPRMCGEHSIDLTISVTALGSSPHVRGAR